MEVIMEDNNLVIDCFSKSSKGGCIALNYTAKDLSLEKCSKCRFKKTFNEYYNDKVKLKNYRCRLKGFNLIFDGNNVGFFENIKEIDNWLKTYLEAHLQEERMPLNKVEEGIDFRDFNLLFYNHSIIFKPV